EALRRARLHCWQFERPSCEAVSRPQTPADLRKANVFDEFDALREFRRTRQEDAWKFFDLKDSEKVPDWREQAAFADDSRDEGTFGVKEFCRFVGDTRKLECGYTKETMAQWYELRKDEEPEGCDSGVCARGAYQRGYTCGIFGTRELFAGKPYWIC